MLKTKHRPARCDVTPACDGLVRNRYYPHKLLTSAGFAAEQEYMVERRRLLNRALHGWGVVGGLDVALDAGRLAVSPGVALDRHGREIVLTKSELISWCDVLVDGRCHERERPHIPPGHWLLSAHYAERKIDRVRISDDCGCGEEEWDGVCETVVFALTPLREECCECGDPACPEECGCIGDGCFDPVTRLGHDKQPQAALPRPAQEGQAAAPTPVTTDEGESDNNENQRPSPHQHGGAPPYPRGPHATLCCWSKGAEVLVEPERLCECKGVLLDPCDGVPLACLAIRKCEHELAEQSPKGRDGHGRLDCDRPASASEPCCDPKVEAVDACTARRFVKRTDMLFDLIRGCDLTRIVHVSWQRWLPRREVEWEEFAGFFHPRPPGDPDAEKDCPTDFTIEFSGPVFSDTVNRLDVSITAWFYDGDSGWFEPLRVPLAGINCEQTAGDPPGTCRRATLVANWDWWSDEIRNRNSEFKGDWDRRENYPIVDIEIDGNRILDCRGQPIAAAAFGPAVTPTGLGYPGGLCRSSFRVIPPHR